MARRSLLFLPVVIAAVVVASASASVSAQDPLSERMHLTKADNALASRISLQRSDLSAGWKPLPSFPRDTAGMRCPGYRPDFSAITVTGHQERDFSQSPKTVLRVASEVDVFATLEQAQKDWKLSMTSAAAKCLGSVLVGNDPAVHLVSARLVPGPPLGEHSAKFAWVVSVKSPTGQVALHLDLLVVLQGRVIAGLFTTSAPHSATGQGLVLSRMVSRMEKPSA